MESYIVRIYRYKKNKPKRLVGTIEKVGSKTGKMAFTNLEEMWDILNSSQIKYKGFYCNFYKSAAKQKERGDTEPV